MGKIARKTITRKARYRPSAFADADLCTRFQQGDLTAFSDLIAIYERLLQTVASKYAGSVLAEPEVMLFAKIGLLKAAHRYDESKMVSFRLYAIWWMRQSVLKALNEQSRIDQVPEMLIQNMNEMIHSFRESKIPSHETGITGLPDVVKEEILTIQKTQRSSRKPS